MSLLLRDGLKSFFPEVLLVRNDNRLSTLSLNTMESVSCVVVMWSDTKF